MAPIKIVCPVPAVTENRVLMVSGLEGTQEPCPKRLAGGWPGAPVRAPLESPGNENVTVPLACCPPHVIVGRVNVTSLPETVPAGPGGGLQFVKMYGMTVEEPPVRGKVCCCATSPGSSPNKESQH